MQINTQDVYGRGRTRVACHQRHIPGYAEIYESIHHSESDPDKLSDILESEAKHEGLPAPAARGVPRVFKLM